MRLRLLQFRLKTLFIVVGLLAIVLTYGVTRIRKGQRQMNAIRVVLDSGGHPSLASNYDSDGKYLHAYQRQGPPETPWEHSSDHVVGLRLNLGRLNQSPVSIDQLVNAVDSFPLLRSLDVEGKGVFKLELLSWATTRNLQELSLCGMRLNDKHCQLIAKIQTLETVNLCGNNITDDGLSVLCNLPRLRELELCNNKITGEQVSSLKQLRFLTYLDLSGNTIPQSVLEQIRLANPQLHLEYDLVHRCPSVAY